jgi:hypothetical protein
MKELLEAFREMFTSDIIASEKRPGLWSLRVGVYYDDGDPVEVFVEKKGDGAYRFRDAGLAIMRTSDTSEAFARKVNLTAASVENDEIFIDAKLDDAAIALLNITFAIKSAGDNK